MTLSQIISKYGNEQFNDIEKTICKNTLIDNQTNTVFSPGGSLCLHRCVSEIYKDKTVMVWLDPPLDFITKNVGDLRKRGVVMEENQTIEDIYNKRKTRYNEVYDIKICSTDYNKLIDLFTKLYV